MYDSLSSKVAREMFGADAEVDEIDAEGGDFKMKTPSWLLPALAGAAGGAGLTALGFTLFQGKGKKKSAAAFAGVDPRTIDARKNDMRNGGDEFGFGGGLDSLGDKVSSEMFGGVIDRSDFFGGEEFGGVIDRSDLFGALDSPSLFAEEEYGYAIPSWVLLQGRELSLYTRSHGFKDLPYARLERLLTRRGTTSTFRDLVKSELLRRQAPRF